MNRLAKSFELSSWAAAWVGPKIFSPAARKASTTPAARGASGPTTVRTIFSARAKSTSSATPVTGTLTTPSSRAVPALPGATNTLVERGERASFQARACSRPPLPITRIFMPVSFLVAEMPHAGEYHRHAVLIGGGDDFLVPHGAAGLDHRGDASLGGRVNAVAEGEEGIACHHRALHF